MATFFKETRQSGYYGLIEDCSIQHMQLVSHVIAKLAEAGAVTMEGIEPRFTNSFINYVSFALAKIPEREQSLQAWQDLIIGFHKSLSSLTLEELLATLSLVCFYMAVEEIPIQDVKP